MKITHQCQESTIIPRFHELQSKVHQRLLGQCDTIDEPYEEGYAISMGTYRREIILEP